jgi:large subunit ribosomal protein L19
MVKLNTQQIISIEQNFLKKDLPILKIGDSVKSELKSLKELKNEFNFMKEQLSLEKNSSINTTITVRKSLQELVLKGTVVHSPKLDSITVLRSSKS